MGSGSAFDPASIAHRRSGPALKVFRWVDRQNIESFSFRGEHVGQGEAPSGALKFQWASTKWPLSLSGLESGFAQAGGGGSHQFA